MITFAPDSPWEIGQVVMFRDGDKPPVAKIITSVEHSEDGMESQYQFKDAPANWGTPSFDNGQGS